MVVEWEEQHVLDQLHQVQTQQTLWGRLCYLDEMCGGCSWGWGCDCWLLSLRLLLLQSDVLTLGHSNVNDSDGHA